MKTQFVFNLQRKNSIIVLLLIVILGSGCITVVQQKEEKTEKTPEEKSLEVDKQLIAQHELEESRIKHVKRTNPEPLFPIKSYKITHGKYYNKIAVTIKVNSPNYYKYLYIKWLLVDKEGKEIEPERSEENWGSFGAPRFNKNNTEFAEWQLRDGINPKTAKILIARVGVDDKTEWDYEDAKIKE